MDKRIVPRKHGSLYECTDCSWQGHWEDVNAGVCPECGAEVEEFIEYKDNGDDD